MYGDGRAFALRSTYARLRQALDYEDVFIGEVEYIDYERQWMPEGNSFYPFMHKRKSFEHENELRAVIQLFPSGDNGGLDWDKPPTEFGVWRDVQLGEMISEVLVFPGAPGWIPGVLRDLLSRYGLNIPVRQSSLDKEPFY